jgi:hypothetical protein
MKLAKVPRIIAHIAHENIIAKQNGEKKAIMESFYVNAYPTHQ